MYEFDSRGLGQVASEPYSVVGTPTAQTVQTALGPLARVSLSLIGRSGLRHSCHCYEGLPRDAVAATVRPYAVEFSTGLFGKKYECGCDQMWSTCPTEMRPIPASPDYAEKKKACDAFIAEAKKRLPEAYHDIEDEQFRLAVAQNIGRAFGIPESKIATLKPAEFLTVAEEKSRRAAGIWALSAITVAAGGGYLLWSFLRGRKKAKP